MWDTHALETADTLAAWVQSGEWDQAYTVEIPAKCTDGTAREGVFAVKGSTGVIVKPELGGSYESVTICRFASPEEATARITDGAAELSQIVAMLSHDGLAAVLAGDLDGPEAPSIVLGATHVDREAGTVRSVIVADPLPVLGDDDFPEDTGYHA